MRLPGMTELQLEAVSELAEQLGDMSVPGWEQLPLRFSRAGRKSSSHDLRVHVTFELRTDAEKQRYLQDQLRLFEEMTKVEAPF